MWAGRMDAEADVAGMVALARTADSAPTRVAGGLVGSGRVGLRLRHPAGPRHRPVVQRHPGDAARGRHGLLLPGGGLHVPVNYDCQRLHGLGKPYSHGELQALREIGDAAALARLNKRHTVTVDGSASVEEGAAQEPPDLLAWVGTS